MLTRDVTRLFECRTVEYYCSPAFSNGASAANDDVERKGEIGSQRSHFNQFRSSTASLMLFPSRVAFHRFFQEVSLPSNAQTVPKRALNWDELQQRYLKLPQASAIKFQVVEAFKLVPKCESFTFYVPLQLVSQFPWYLIANE